MNKKNAKTITLTDAKELLPKWWIDSLNIDLSIIKHSKYVSFQHAATFFEASLSDIVDSETSLKHIKVKCINKGEKDGKIYLTIEVYFKLHDTDKLFKFEKSLHVTKRPKMTHD